MFSILLGVVLYGYRGAGEISIGGEVVYEDRAYEVRDIIKYDAAGGPVSYKKIRGGNYAVIIWRRGEGRIMVSSENLAAKK